MKLPESSLHSNVEPDSLEENVKVALVELVVPEGPESIVVWGAVVSTVQVLVAGVWSVFPTLSVARTENVESKHRPSKVNCRRSDNELCRSGRASPVHVLQRSKACHSMSRRA